VDDEIEELLRGTGVEPHGTLRGRVLLAVRTELRDSNSASRWRNAATAAAMAVLWIHVTWSAALNGRIDSTSMSIQELNQSAQQIQDLLPELSVSETQRMALRLSVGTSRPPTFVLPR